MKETDEKPREVRVFLPIGLSRQVKGDAGYLDITMPEMILRIVSAHYGHSVKPETRKVAAGA